MASTVWFWSAPAVEASLNVSRAVQECARGARHGAGWLFPPGPGREIQRRPPEGNFFDFSGGVLTVEGVPALAADEGDRAAGAGGVGATDTGAERQPFDATELLGVPCWLFASS